MSSALISLAAYGKGYVQEPDLSHFNAGYVKHTNFAIESYKTISTNGDVFGTKSLFDIPRIGDMITGATLEFDLPNIETATPTTPVQTSNTYVLSNGRHFQIDREASTIETLTTAPTNIIGGTDSNYKSSRVTTVFLRRNVWSKMDDLCDKVLSLRPKQSNAYFGRMDMIDNPPLGQTVGVSLYITSITLIDDIVKVSGFNNSNSDIPSDFIKVIVYEQHNYTPQYGYINNEGFASVESVEFSIGSQVIQRLSGEYLYTNSRVNVTASNRDIVEKLNGTISQFPLKNYNGLAASSVAEIEALPEWTRDVTKTVEDELISSDVYFPYGKDHDKAQLEKNGVYPRRQVINLPFWFTEHISKSVPLCAITKQEMNVRVKFRDYHSLLYNVYGPIDVSDPRINNKKLENVSLKLEYAFLDKFEIDFMRNRDMNMVVSQLQMNEFQVPKTETTKTYDDMVFEDFRNNFNTTWENYHINEKFRLQFDNSVSRMYFLVQNDEYAKNPGDNPGVWYGNQWFNYMPETTGYLFNSRTNNQQVQYNDTKTSSNINYQVVWSDTGVPTAPTAFSNNFPDSYIPGGVEPKIGDGEMTWTLPDSSNVDCPFFSKFINPQTGARRRDQYLIFNKTDMWDNDNEAWWSNVHQYDFLQITETSKWTGANSDPANTPADIDPFITYEFSFDNVVTFGTDHIYVAAHDVSFRNSNWDWGYTGTGQSSNVVGASSNFIEVTAGNYLDKGKFLHNITNWPYMNQIKNLELTFNGDTVLPKEVADTLFLTGVQSLNHDKTIPFDLTNINAARPGPFQLLSNVAITSNTVTGYDFNVTTESKVPFLENIYKYDFGLTNINSEKYPTGQVNASRIKDNMVEVNFMPSKSDRKLRVYAESYNVLQIKNGIAGILFTCGNLVK